MKCDQPIRFQMTQRLPDGHGAYVKGFSQFILTQTFPRLELAAQNSAANGIYNGILNIAVGDEGRI
jgi:hypothetical protein